MANMVTHTSYAKNQKQILIGQDSYYIALPIVLTGSANATIYAGQIRELKLKAGATRVGCHRN